MLSCPSLSLSNWIPGQSSLLTMVRHVAIPRVAFRERGWEVPRNPIAPLEIPIFNIVFRQLKLCSLSLNLHLNSCLLYLTHWRNFTSFISCWSILKVIKKRISNGHNVPLAQGKYPLVIFSHVATCMYWDTSQKKKKKFLKFVSTMLHNLVSG